MATEAVPRLLVLHALKLKGFADDPVVAERVGLSQAEARAALEKLAGAWPCAATAAYRDGP
jgi:hypothetical protein